METFIFYVDYGGTVSDIYSLNDPVDPSKIELDTGYFVIPDEYVTEKPSILWLAGSIDDGYSGLKVYRTKDSGSEIIHELVEDYKGDLDESEDQDDLDEIEWDVKHTGIHERDRDAMSIDTLILKPIQVQLVDKRVEVKWY